MSGFTDRLSKLLDGHKATGYEAIDVDSTAIATLTPPVAANPKDRAYFALITPILDAAATEVKNALHFREDGGDPSTVIGMPLGEGGVYTLIGFKQIENFKIIATEVGVTHSVRVTYYKLGKE